VPGVVSAWVSAGEARNFRPESSGVVVRDVRPLRRVVVIAVLLVSMYLGRKIHGEKA
jgi:hypothetical protein